MKSIAVELGVRSYPIIIGFNLLAQDGIFERYLQHKHVLIVSNDTVAPLYLKQLQTRLEQFQSADPVILPDGERYKTFEYLNSIFSSLLDQNMGRDTVLLALGGGVIGDITGFAAACYQRGVDFIQIPTTLLSQVDSSVGGKTAVNHPKGKNMIGAFYQPKLVVIDTACLATLPPREFAAGMAEVIKYGIIWDQPFFCWLEQNSVAIKASDQQSIQYLIGRCCEIKADIVAQDETEQGLRALLNLGHTFGHAIETEMGYGVWLHGEAVAVGTVLAARVACKKGLIDSALVERIIKLFNAFDLPTEAPASMGFNQFISHMRRDKKVIGGKIRLILPQAIGRAGIYTEVDEAVLKEVIDSKK